MFSVNWFNYLLVFLSEPGNSVEMLYVHFTFVSHCQTTCTTDICSVMWPQNKAQGLLWVLKKCLWMQQQLFLRPVLVVFISEAMIVILTFGSDTISHSHFKVFAWLPKISSVLVTLFQRLANVPGHCSGIMEERVLSAHSYRGAWREGGVTYSSSSFIDGSQITY